MSKYKDRLTMAAITLLCVVGFSLAGAKVITVAQPSAADQSTDSVYASLANGFAPVIPPGSDDVTAAKVIVKAQEMGEIGELIRIDVSGSRGTQFKWLIVPASLDFEVYEDGKRAVFSARVPGDYMFIIACSLDGTVDVVTHTITIIGDVPDPVPGPNVYPVVPKPAADASFTLWTAYWCSQSQQDRSESLKLAASFDSVASTIAAGINTTPKQIIETTAKVNRQALGTSIDRWVPMLSSLQAELKRRAELGTLRTAEQHAVAWREIAEGLKVYASLFSVTDKKPVILK